MGAFSPAESVPRGECAARGGMDEEHKRFCESLTPEEKMLITLRDELYFGAWDKMLKDLKDRLKGRPYIFKLVNRIEEDIERIERLQEYEVKHKVNLAVYLKELEDEG